MKFENKRKTKKNFKWNKFWNHISTFLNLKSNNVHIFFEKWASKNYGRVGCRWLWIRPQNALQSRCQFHQHFTSPFFVRNCFAQLSLVTFQLCNFWRQNINKKYAHKLLMKLAQVHNILGALFEPISFCRKRNTQTANLLKAAKTHV